MLKYEWRGSEICRTVKWRRLRNKARRKHNITLSARECVCMYPVYGSICTYIVVSLSASKPALAYIRACDVCVCVSASGREMIGSPLRASLSLQHVETMARCQDTSPQSVLTSRHEEQRLIIYKHTPVRCDDLPLFLH